MASYQRVTKRKRPDPPKQKSIEPGAVVKVKMNPWDLVNPQYSDSSDEGQQGCKGKEVSKHFVSYQTETKHQDETPTESPTSSALDGSKYVNKWIDSQSAKGKKALIKKYWNGRFQILECDDKNYWKYVTKEQLAKSIRFDPSVIPQNSVTKKQLFESYTMFMQSHT